jgi:hypothetical protein
MLANESADTFVPCGLKLGRTGFSISGNSIFSATGSSTDGTSIVETTDSVACISSIIAAEG